MDMIINRSLGFKLTRFHELWSIMILQGLNRENRAEYRDSKRHQDEARAWRLPGGAGRPHPRMVGLGPLAIGPSFVWWCSTDLRIASQPLFNVSLIQGLGFIPPDYIIRPRPPLWHQFNLS
jgi:hypothetical protein